MIAGETEQMTDGHLQDQYDDFFGNKKKRRARRARRRSRRLAKRTARRSAPKWMERKEKRQRLFKDVGQVYRDIGGATAIGAAIDSITSPKLPKANGYSNTHEASDFLIAVGAPKEAEEEKKGIPTVVYVLGGIVILGVVGMAVISGRRNKQYLNHQQ